VWRYLVSGSSAAVVDLGLLYGLTEWASLHYLASATIAFVAAFFVSFFLQKFWTFQDHSVERVHAQVALYFVIAVANLGLNTLLMYLFVEYLHLWYLAAQILAGSAIACESFFISRHFVFKTRVCRDRSADAGT
jgi:putative flippase GtrA